MTELGSSTFPVLVVGAAYLLGAIPFGLLLGRIAGGLDVRRVGSGNIGATNVARSLGPWAGILTLALDVGKGAAAVWAAWRLTGQPGTAMAAGLAAVAGHVFPVYLGFHGGKGVATGLGAFLVLEPRATLMAGVIFLAAVAASRRISPGSILAAASLPFLLYFRRAAPPLILSGFAASLLILYRHGSNMRRLLAGTEPKLGEGRR
jgi:glycerol-3-phosphate acyltransferase PlsY